VAGVELYVGLRTSAWRWGWILRNVDLAWPYTSIFGERLGEATPAIMGFSGYCDRGRILLNGEDITKLPINERASRGIGIMMQRPPNLVGVRLRNMVKVTGKGNVDPDVAAKELDMEPFLERDVNVGFSGGEIKRSELLQLGAQNPCLYLLDEPESGVDLVSIEKVGAKVHDMLRGGTSCRLKMQAARLPGDHPHRPDTDFIEADRATCQAGRSPALEPQDYWPR
jgi:Fe-S cluster assembly ATP-binding protein